MIRHLRPSPAYDPADYADALLDDPRAETILRLVDEAREHGASCELAHADAPLARALRLAETLDRDGDDRHALVALASIHLAWLDSARGRHEQAVAHARRALAVREDCFGPDHPETLAAVEELAAALFDAEARDDEADALAIRAIDAYDEAGRDDAGFAALIATVGWRRYWIGRYAEAEPLFCRALDLRRRLLGPDHLDTADIAKRLAVMYDHRGFDDDPEPLYREALDGHRAALGPGHPRTLEACYRLADYLDRRGRADEAAPLFDRLAAALTGPSPPVAPEDVFWMLGPCCDHLRARGREAVAGAIEAWAAGYDVMVVMQRNDAERAECLFGPDSPELADALNHLAIAYAGAGRGDEAEAAFQRALDIEQTRLGPDHPACGVLRDRLSRARAKAAEAVASRGTPRRLGRPKPKLFDPFTAPWLDDRRDALIEAYLTHAAGRDEVGPDGDDDPTGAGMAIVALGFDLDLDDAWDFLRDLIAAAPDDDQVLGHLAAGPVEGFLGRFDAEAIDRVEAVASRNPKLRRILTGVWQHSMSDPVWARVRRLQAAEPRPLAALRPHPDEPAPSADSN